METMHTDALVIGGGIAGLQAALDLAEQDLSVVVVEKEPSIGGKMIALSKVFPTLDCSSCICTPKMASAAHHEKITLLTYTDVTSTKRMGPRFMVKAVKKPRYVVEEDCIGCRLCEFACESFVESEFEGGLGARKAIHVPFSSAVPQLAVLDIDNCNFCGRCAKACPTNAINYLDEPEEVEIDTGTIILATGYEPTAVEELEQYGRGRFHNVLSALKVERLLAPHGPYGRVLRPSDGKVPDTVAFIQCAGSRDQSLGVPWCSRVCCMYAVKQAMLLAGSLPLVDITIYYMDIRAFGKGFEQFYRSAGAMDIEFVKSKVAIITEDEDQNPVVRFESLEGGGQVEERTHDLVVLSPGLVAAWNPEGIVPVKTADDGFVLTPDPVLNPCSTDVQGIYVAGAAAGPKDIPDSILDAGAAAMAAANYLRSTRRTPVLTGAGVEGSHDS